MGVAITVVNTTTEDLLSVLIIIVVHHDRRRLNVVEAVEVVHYSLYRFNDDQDQ